MFLGIVLAYPPPTTEPALQSAGLGAVKTSQHVVLSAWIALLVPAKTPQPIVDKLSKSAKAFLYSDAKNKLIDIGMEPVADEAKPLAQVISEEIRIHADLVKAAGLVPQ